MLFYKNTLLQCLLLLLYVVWSLKHVIVPSLILITFGVSELHASYRNVWPEAVYTKITLFTEN